MKVIISEIMEDKNVFEREASFDKIKKSLR